MPNYLAYAGAKTRVTVTGTLSIGAAGAKMALVGFLVGSCNTTAPSVSIWEGQTTGSTTIIGVCTLTRNAFTQFPAYCSGGATFNFFNSDTQLDVTIYWNPLG